MFLEKKKVGIKVFILLFLALISLSSCFAEEINITETIESSAPRISIHFEEPVIAINASLHAAENPNQIYADFSYGINISYSNYEGIENATVTYEINKFLENGFYELDIIVDDVFGNRAYYEVLFEIEAQLITISLIDPYQGWADNFSFRFEVETVGEPASCWYSPNDFDFSGGLTETVELNTTSNTLNHYDEEFNHNIIYPHTLINAFVVCEKNDDHGLTGKYFELYWDDTIPIVRYDVSEDILRDRSYPYINLTATSLYNSVSNDPQDDIGCKFQENTGDYQSFTNSDFDNVSTYNIKNYILLNFTDEKAQWDALGELFDEHSMNYTISCRNSAGLYSDPEEFDLELIVHFTREFNIEQLSPAEYINDYSPLIRIKSTVNTDWCNISNSYTDETVMTGGSRIYEYPALDNVEGSYDYTVKCRSELGDYVKEEQIEFTIDKTAPENLTISARDNTCSLSKIKFDLDADDDSAGIDYFNYNITGPNSTIIKSDIVSKSQADDIEVSEDLIENATYTITVYVYDRAGNNAGPAIKTITATGSSIDACDSHPPSITFNETKELGVTYVQVDCEDSRSGCADAYDYDILSNVTDDCTYLSSGSWSVSSEYSIYTRAKICIRAQDHNDNEKTESKIINIDFNDSCANSEMDGDETNVDCGGSCSPCLDGDSCLIDSDCESNWCNNNICENSACDDIFLNGYETDVDCGGVSCDGCEDGKLCISNGDCLSNWCDEEICKLSFCDDFIWNGFETDVDCGGDNCTACEIGQNCNIDSDCLSDYCEYGTCTEGNEPYPILEDKKANIFAIILLILGILLSLGGVGYLIYDKYYLQPLQPKKNLNTEAKQFVPEKKKLTKEQILALHKKRELMKNKFKQKVSETKDKLSSKFSAFEEKTEEVKKRKEKEHSDKAKDTINNLKKIWNPEHSISPLDKEKLDSGLKGEYVKLGELKENATKILDKNPGVKKKYGKDIFAALERIQSKIDNKAKSSIKKEDKEKTIIEPIKKYATEDDFKKLDELIKKTKEESQDKALPIKTQITPEKNQQEEKQDNLQNKEDVFAALDEIASKSVSKKTKSSTTETEPITSFSSDNLVDLFKNKGVNIDVFKVILKELMETNKLNKKDVSGIIFRLLEQKLVEKDVAHKILKELNFINK